MRFEVFFLFFFRSDLPLILTDDNDGIEFAPTPKQKRACQKFITFYFHDFINSLILLAFHTFSLLQVNENEEKKTAATKYGDF